MTITRIGSPEASIAGVECLQCSAAAARKERASWRGKGTEGLIRKTIAVVQEAANARDYVPFDELTGQETGAGEAERLVVGHDKLHPRHNIVLWRFDKHHLLSAKEVR